MKPNQLSNEDRKLQLSNEDRKLHFVHEQLKLNLVLDVLNYNGPITGQLGLDDDLQPNQGIPAAIVSSAH